MVVAVALVGLLVVADAATVVADSCVGGAGERAVVARVIDGETLALTDGRIVRLDGALAPRASDVAADAGAWTAENSTRDSLRDLVVGRAVTLKASDGSDVPARDRGGRLLAQVFVEREGGGVVAWVQETLIRMGLARIYRADGGNGCLGLLLEREADARLERLGLWQVHGYRPLLLGGRGPPSGIDAGFHVFYGRIRRVVATRQGLRVVFERSPGMVGKALIVAAVVERGDKLWDLIGRGRGRHLAGEWVELRGWTVRRPGFREFAVDISGGGFLRLLRETGDGSREVLQSSGSKIIEVGTAAQPERDGQSTLNAQTTTPKR